MTANINIANLRHDQNDEVCDWVCRMCGRLNYEYKPFPMVGLCDKCGHEEFNYCPHKPEVVA